MVIFAHVIIFNNKNHHINSERLFLMVIYVLYIIVIEYLYTFKNCTIQTLHKYYNILFIF